MKINKIKYFSQVWERDTLCKEHILGQNQVALWNDPSYGVNPVLLQHRVLAVPVSDKNSMEVLGAYKSVEIPTVSQMGNPAQYALFCEEAEEKISAAFGWFFQGLHGTNPWIPSERMFSDKFSGFRQGGQLTVQDVAGIFQAAYTPYKTMDSFLPHIMVSPLDENDAGDVMYDIVERKNVKVVDTGLLSTFRVRPSLLHEVGDFAADILLRYRVAKLWEMTSTRNASYEACWNASKYAKFYIGYKFDPRLATDQAPIAAEEAVRKLPRRMCLADLSSSTTALAPLLSDQPAIVAATQAELRYGAPGIKTY